MFAENKKISKRQLQRQIVIGSLCFALLFVNPKILRIDTYSVWGILVGFFVILFLGRYLSTIKPEYKGTENRYGGWVQTICSGICVAYSIVIGALLLHRVTGLVKTYFLSDTKSWVIQLIILFVVFLGMRGELQQHGRMMEIFYTVFILAGIVVLVSVIWQLPMHRFLEMRTWTTNMFRVDMQSVAKGFLWTMIAGAGVLYIPFFMGNVNIQSSKKRMVSMLIELGFVFFILLFLLYHIKFGIYGYQAKAFPMVSLVHSSNLWWVSLVVFAFLLTLSNLLFLGDYIIRIKGIMWARYLIIAFVFLLQFAF